MKRSPDATVIVATYNRPKALRIVLTALLEQAVVPDVIVADDGSAEETAIVVNRFRDLGLVSHHCWQPDQGFRKSAALNKALRLAKGPTTIFLDGDCIPLSGFIEDHLRLQQQGFVVAGPRILVDQPLTQAIEELGQPYPRGLLELVRARLSGQVNRILPALPIPFDAFRTSHPHRWQSLRGCNFSAQTADLLRVGGFDESYEGWGLEDSDLAIRLMNAGVLMKSGRFAAPVLHLWHREESRGRLAQNQAVLEETLASGRYRPHLGIERLGHP